MTIGDRHRYKSSVCRVLDDKRDQYGRVFVYWEGEYFTGWVDVESSSYRQIEAIPGEVEP